MDFKFNVSTHEYLLDGKKIPSVTQLIPDLGEFNFVNEKVLENAREEGKKNHYSIEVSIRNNKPIDDYSKRFFDLIKNLAITNKFPEIWFSEKQFCEETYLFAGTPDLVLVDHEMKEFCIIDLKRSFSNFIYKYELQLAGYNILIKNQNREYKCTGKYIIAINDQKDKIQKLGHTHAESHFMMLVRQYHNTNNLVNFIKDYKS